MSEISRIRGMEQTKHKLNGDYDKYEKYNN